MLKNVNPEVIMSLSNLLYFVLFTFSALYYFLSIRGVRLEQQSGFEEHTIYKQQMRKKKRSLGSGFVSDYLVLLEVFFEQKTTEKTQGRVTSVLVIGLVIATGFSSLVSLPVGFLSFFIYNLAVSVIIKNLTESKSRGSEYRLPEVIDVLVRCFSKSDELQMVIYETSLDIDEPYRQMFSDMARKMTSSGHMSVLREYSSKTDSVWMNSLFSILMRYKEDAKKSETLKNLRNLRDMISQENKLKRSLISDKSYSVFLNYIITSVAVAGNIIIFLFFPNVASLTFLMSGFGMFMLLLGYLCVGLVFIITKKLQGKNNMKARG